MVDSLIAGFKTFEDHKIPVVILRAKKDAKVWSAGHDVTELPKTQRDPLGYNDPLEKLLRCVEHYPGPVIALIQGSVWGGALDLVLTCDVVIGDPSCSFAITPVKLGLPYNATGILHFLNRLPMNIAKEMFFTAKPMFPERAEHKGILNHLVASDQIESFTLELANSITNHSGLSIAVVKEQFRLLSGAHPLSPETFERIQGLRRFP